jgi:hypothetical protein
VHVKKFSTTNFKYWISWVIYVSIIAILQPSFEKDPFDTAQVTNMTDNEWRDINSFLKPYYFIPVDESSRHDKFQ